MKEAEVKDSVRANDFFLSFVFKAQSCNGHCCHVTSVTKPDAENKLSFNTNAVEVKTSCCSSGKFSYVISYK